jgi:hypothetical protein
MKDEGHNAAALVDAWLNFLANVDAGHVEVKYTDKDPFSAAGTVGNFNGAREALKALGLI